MSDNMRGGMARSLSCVESAGARAALASDALRVAVEDLWKARCSESTEGDWHTAFEIVRDWQAPHHYAPLIDAIARALAAERRRAARELRDAADAYEGQVELWVPEDLRARAEALDVGEL